MEDDLRDIVDAAGRRPEALAAVRDLHERAMAEVARIGPRCDLSGRCCRFDTYGHRLYATTLELALFAGDLRGSGAGGGSVPPSDPGGCPFQRGALCGVHPIRPLGCRMFFCDPSAGPALEAVFERLHGEMKKLHDELGVPYRYVEWREALRALGLGPVWSDRPPIE